MSSTTPLPKVPKDHRNHPVLLIKHYLDLIKDDTRLQNACLNSANITMKAVFNPHTEVCPDQEFAFLRKLLSASSNNLLGFEAGKSFHINCHEHLGFAALSSDTPYQALQSLVAFSELTYSFFKLNLLPHNDVLYLQLVDQYDLGPLSIFYILRDITFLITAGRELIPQRQNSALCKSISLALDPNAFSPLEKERLLNFFMCPIYYNARISRIEFCSEALNHQLPQANTLMCQLFSERCADQLNDQKAQSLFSSQVRQCIQQSKKAIPSFKDVCRQLGTSTRTAHRKLQEENTGFQALLTDELKHNAITQLKAGIAVKQIADNLGYGDTSTFITAFKRWTGHPPGAYINKTIN